MLRPHRSFAPCFRVRFAALLLLAVGASTATAQIDLDSLRWDAVPTLGTFSHEPAIGDFNGDGISDVAVAEFDRVVIYLHDGASRLERQEAILPIEDAQYATEILTADFDGDDALDIAVGQRFVNRLDVFLGDGDGGFVIEQTLEDLETSPSLGTVVDFDRDGNLDMIFGSGLVLLGDGTGRFVPSARLILPGFEGIQVADFDGNGYSDVILHSVDQDFLFPVLADATGALDIGLVPLPELASLFAKCVVRDFDEDGFLDIATTEWILLGDGSGGFGAPYTPPALEGNEAVGAADFNGDGHVDLLVGDFGRRVLFGDGQGGFTDGPSIPIFAYSLMGPIIADFNADGNMDVAELEDADFLLFVALGLGDGSFAPLLTIPTGDDYSDFAAADFDGDSHLDLALLDGDRFAVFYGDGSGDFPTRTVFTDGGDTITAADLNEDGSPDIAIGTGRFETTTVFLNDAAGGFVESGTLAMSTSRDLRAADVNGDGHFDLVSVGGGFTVAKGTGTGAFADVTTYPTSHEPVAFDFGAIDGNASTDVMLLNSVGLYFSGNDGNGNFSFIPAIPAPGGPVELASADVDGDGGLDLVTADMDASTISVYLGDGAGGFERDAAYPTIDRPERLRIADFDRDGRLDAAVAGEGGMEILFGDAKGAFTDTRTVSLDPWDVRNAIGLHDVTIPSSVGLGVQIAFEERLATVRFAGREPIDGSVVVAAPPSESFSASGGLAKADLNGDSHLDVIHADGDSTVQVILGDGSDGFTPGLTLDFENRGAIATGDFDEDGNPDVAIGRAGVDVRMFLGDGAGGLTLGAILPTVVLPTSISVGDVNLDGHLDIVVAGKGDFRPGIDGYVWTFLGDGAGGFADGIPVDGVREPHHVAIGSFDDETDDFIDLLITDHEIGGVTFAYGDGTGTFIRRNSFPIERLNPPTEVAVGDLNRDGHLDVVVAGEGDTAEIRFGAGNGNFPGVLSIAGRGEVRARDLNGDRQIDLLFAGDGTIALGNGRGEFSPPQPWMQGVAARRTGAVTTGFFDDDELIDIVILSEDAIRFHRNRSFDLELCLTGNTDAVNGFHVDVLEVDGSTGGPRRFLAIDSTDGLRVTLDRAPEPAAGGNYYAAIWSGPPQEGTTAVLPASLGFTCFQPIRDEPGYAAPVHVANTIRPADPRLELSGQTATGVPGSALPAIVLDVPAGGLPPIGTFLTVQALVGDRNALGRKLVSVSNGVVIRVE